MIHINNEDNKYIIIRKDIYAKFGFAKGLIIQTLVDGNGEFIGSTGTLHDVISVISITSVKNHLNELESQGFVKKEKVGGWCNKYVLSDKSLISEYCKKHKLPENVRKIVERLNEIKNGNKNI